MTNVTLQENGARIYLVGNTYPIKDQIKSAGGHWDGERKQWWIGRAKRAEIEAALATSSTATPAKQAEQYDGPVRGRVSYTGKSGKTGTYYVRWAGVTSRGTEAVRLTNLAGTLDFWADASEVQWVKRYQDRPAWTHYGRTMYGTGGYPTLSSIRRYIEDKRAEEKDGIPRTRQAHEEMVDMLDQCDDFRGAAAYARAHGIIY